MIVVHHPAAIRLRSLLSLSRAEVLSRANAWPEIVAAGAQVVAALEAEGSKVTAPEISSLASRILSEGYEPTPEEIRSMAGSLLAQDETRGQKAPEIATFEDDPMERADRALEDAQTTGQALPLVAIVERQPVPGEYHERLDRTGRMVGVVPAEKKEKKRDE